MKNSIIRRVAGVLFFASCLMLFQNCGPAKVSSDATEVNNSSGSEDLGSSDPGASPTPNPTATPAPTPTPPGATPTPPVSTPTPTPAPTGPAVMLSRNAIDFGSVDFLSTSGTQTVTITNTGDATLTISKTIVGSEFSFATNVSNNCGTSLAPGASCMIGMRFSPIDPGDSTAMVRVTTNAPDSPHLIQLSGKGRF